MVLVLVVLWERTRLSCTRGGAGRKRENIFLCWQKKEERKKRRGRGGGREKVLMKFYPSVRSAWLCAVSRTTEGQQLYAVAVDQRLPIGLGFSPRSSDLATCDSLRETPKWICGDQIYECLFSFFLLEEPPRLPFSSCSILYLFPEKKKVGEFPGHFAFVKGEEEGNFLFSLTTLFKM